MGHLKNMVFSRLENLNTENYHGTKKLTGNQKNLNAWSISLHVMQMSQPPSPLIF